MGVWLAWMLGIMLSCRADIHVEPFDTNAAPFADAGTGGAYIIGSTITLDASGSFDPDGTIGAYRWSVGTEPSGSASQITDPASAVTTVGMSVAGTYHFDLTVTDNQGVSSTSRLRVTSLAPALTVDAGPNAAATWRRTVQLAGTVASEPGFPFTFGWTFVSKPAGSSAVLAGGGTLVPTFLADREGDYVVRLTAQTAYNSLSDDVTLAVAAPQQLLNYSLVDAEYSKALDRYVIVSESPAQLHLHDPATGTESSLLLASVPRSVAVSPDGHHAAIGQIGKVTIVNLQTMMIETVYSMSIEVADIVWSTDNRVHCFAFGGFGVGDIHTINLTTGVITDNGVYPDGLARARLQPNRLAVYSTRGAGSTSPLRHWNVQTSPVAYVSDSEFGRGFGRNVWFTEDGSTIIGASRNLFFASSDPLIDMTPRGTLAASPGSLEITWAVHSAAAGRIATVGIDYDSNFINVIGYQLRVYDDQQYALQQTIQLPNTTSGGTTYTSEGQFAAYNNAGTTAYVITRSRVGSGFVYGLYGITP